MIVDVLFISGESAVVSWDNKAVVIPASHLSIQSHGKAIVQDNILLSGTEYGIDWTIVLGDDYPIKPKDLQGALRSAGIWTLEDFNQHPNKVLGVIRSFSNGIMADLMAHIRRAMSE